MTHFIQGFMTGYIAIMFFALIWFLISAFMRQLIANAEKNASFRTIPEDEPLPSIDELKHQFSEAKLETANKIVLTRIQKRRLLKLMDKDPEFKKYLPKKPG